MSITARDTAPHTQKPAPALDWALAYRQLGWSPIPINQATKKPPKDFLWKQYQDAPADETTIRSWYTRWPMAGVGIVTGAVSKLWVVDIDSTEGAARVASLDLPPVPTVKTSKGTHLYFTQTGALRNTAKKVEGLDTRGEGGFVVAPPTLHPSGVAYAWETVPWNTAPQVPPPALVALFTEARQPATSREGTDTTGTGDAGDESEETDAYAALLTNGSPAGQRHHDMTRLVGHYLAHGLRTREIAVLLQPWVDRCRPSFPYADLYRVIADLAAAEGRKQARDDSDDSDEATPTGEMPAGQTPEEQPFVGAPTFQEALALPHPTLARRYVDARARLRAADDTLAYIARITKHQAVITPSDDPEAKRKRPVLSHADRVIGVNYALDLRAAGKGLLPTAPVSVYRGQIAAASCASPSTVTASTQQLARAGFLDVTPAPGEREAQLFALPATMPGDISPDNMVDFESSRRRKERRRVCHACGVGTRFEHTTVCMTCGNKEVEIIGDADDDDGGGVVANCNTKVGTVGGGRVAGGTTAALTRGGVVASCNHPPAREDAAQRDRAARDGHRASRDDLPRRTEPDDDDYDDVDAFFAANPPPETTPPPPPPPPIPPPPATLSMDLDLTSTVAAPSPSVVDAPDSKPTGRCQTCKTENPRWSDRWQEWQCATCYPAPVKNATGLLNIVTGPAIGQQEARHGH